MSKRLLRIDVSNLRHLKEEDLFKIRFQNDDLQINFAKFFIQSQYIHDKYKYSEALDSIQSEIEEIKQKMNISQESIKYFIQLIQEEKVDFPINHYKDIYTLSEYFCIPKFTNELDNISQKELFKDLDFTIQFLVDLETENNSLETKLMSKIENFLKERINECIKNKKFGELQVSTIYRILNQCIEKVDHNSLTDFIFESVDTRFILLKLIKLHRMTEMKAGEFIKFIEKQEESIKKCIWNTYHSIFHSFI